MYELRQYVLGATVSGCADGSDPSVTGYCADGTSPVYGPSAPNPVDLQPTLAELGVTASTNPQGQTVYTGPGGISYTSTGAGFTTADFQSWLKANSTLAIGGAVAFVVLLMLLSGGRRR